MNASPGTRPGGRAELFASEQRCSQRTSCSVAPRSLGTEPAAEGLRAPVSFISKPELNMNILHSEILLMPIKEEALSLRGCTSPEVFVSYFL